MDSTKYKSAIEEELALLEKQLNELGIKNPSAPEDWIPLPKDTETNEPDPNMFGDRSEEWQETRGTLDALETRYNNLTRALKKITTESYGLCEVCNSPIEEDRLSVNPAARTCKAHLEEEPGLSK